MLLLLELLLLMLLLLELLLDESLLLRVDTLELPLLRPRVLGHCLLPAETRGTVCAPLRHGRPLARDAGDASTALPGAFLCITVGR